jgi:hypothetical protein
MDICPQYTQNDMLLHEQVKTAIEGAITDNLQKQTRSGTFYGGRKTRRNRKMYGGAQYHCHMICAAMLAAMGGMTMAGVYAFYGASAGMLENAMGRHALCTPGIQGFGEDALRYALRQPSCKQSAENYYRNVENLYITINTIVGTITTATFIGMYGTIYKKVAEFTGCEGTNTIPASGSNCAIVQGGFVGNTTAIEHANDNKVIQQVNTIPPESLDFLNELKTVINKSGGKRNKSRAKKSKRKNNK